jgi:SPP1 family predicted phage head-tail adaptor
MRGADLRHRITFQSRSATPDEYGGQADTWSDSIPNVAAGIETLKGRELIAAQAINNESTSLITTRYFASFNTITSTAMRIVFNGRIFNILDATNVNERNRELQFLCSEGLSQG